MDYQTLEAGVICFGPSTTWCWDPIAEDTTFWVIELGEIRLVPTWKCHTYWLVFLVLEDAVHANRGEKQWSYPDVNPESYVPWVQYWHVCYGVDIKPLLMNSCLAPTTGPRTQAGQELAQSKSLLLFFWSMDTEVNFFPRCHLYTHRLIHLSASSEKLIFVDDGSEHQAHNWSVCKDYKSL